MAEKLPDSVFDQYQRNELSHGMRQSLEDLVRRGVVEVPQGFKMGETPDRGILGTIKAAFTGEDQWTPEIAEMPEFGWMPELGLASPNTLNAIKASFGTVTASTPREIAQIIKANFPEVGVRQDDRGNYIFKSAADNKEYAIHPGFQLLDTLRLGGQVMSFLPAGRAKTAAGRILGAAGTQAAIESGQAAVGGEFDPAEVVMAGALEGGAEALMAGARGVQAARQAFRGDEAADIGAEAAQRQAAEAAGQVPISKQAMSPQEIARTATEAAGGGIGSRTATEILASEIRPDPEVLAAADRLGITEFLQPDHVTTSQAYRELLQAIKSKPGSMMRQTEIDQLKKIGDRAEQVVEEAGGTRDLSQLSEEVKGTMTRTVKELEDLAEVKYGEVADAIDPKTATPATNTLRFLDQRADERGGVEFLSPIERSVRRKVLEDPTFARVDDARKEVGRAAGRQGHFKDADTAIAKRLYGLLTDDQMPIAEAAGVGETLQAGKAVVKLRKGIEDDMIGLFGKQLDRSLVTPLMTSTRALEKGDVGRFVKMLKAIPSTHRQDFVASAIGSAFGKATRNGDLNFNTFARWYEGLQSNQQAMNAVMSNLPPNARKRVRDLAKVSSNIAKATRERIETGRLQVMEDLLRGPDSLIAKVYDIGKRSAIGLPIEAATTSVGLPGAGMAAAVTNALRSQPTDALRAADDLVTSDEFTRFAKRAIASESNTVSKKAARRLALSRAFREFAEAVKMPTSLSWRTQWILAAMQAAKPSTQSPNGDRQ